MSVLQWNGLLALVFVVGCGYTTTTTIPMKSTATAPAETSSATAKEDEEASIQKALAKLSPEDRKLAEAQRFCAVEVESRLGSMGTPVKLTLEDRPVFLCCAGCKKAAARDPDKTLAQVEALKARTNPEKKSTEIEEK